jgi:DNA repair protein RadC
MYEQLSLIGKERKKDKKNLEIRERLKKYGVASLLDKEAVAFLCDISLEKLDQLETFEDLRNRYQLLPLTKIQKQKIEAIFDISVRIATEKASKDAFIKCPNDIYDLLGEEMRHLKREEFRIVLLNTKNKVLGIKTISIGSLNASIVHPREVLKEAILNSCASFIAVHNHPSAAIPIVASAEDIEITKRLKQASEIIGIQLLDHVILSGNSFLSLRQHGLI